MVLCSFLLLSLSFASPATIPGLLSSASHASFRCVVVPVFNCREDLGVGAAIVVASCFILLFSLSNLNLVATKWGMPNARAKAAEF